MHPYQDSAAFDFSVSTPEEREAFCKKLSSVGLNLLYSDSTSYSISGVQIALLAAIVFLLLLIPLSLWVLTRSVSRPIICNQGEVVRAFYALLKATDTAKEKQQPENAGKPWTTDLVNELKERFESGESVSALGRYFGRTRNSIESRLVKLGLKEME